MTKDEKPGLDPTEPDSTVVNAEAANDVPEPPVEDPAPTVIGEPASVVAPPAAPVEAEAKSAAKDEEYKKFAQGPIFLYTVAILALASFVLSLFALVASTADDDDDFRGPGQNHSYFDDEDGDEREGFRDRGEGHSEGDWNNRGRVPGPDVQPAPVEPAPETLPAPVDPNGGIAPLPEVAPVDPQVMPGEPNVRMQSF